MIVTFNSADVTLTQEDQLEEWVVSGVFVLMKLAKKPQHS